MNYRLDDVVLRRPEPRDLDALYRQKNDPLTAGQLGGFSRGFARADVADWIDRHRQAADETLWVIADGADDSCLGHAGLYRIDHRVGAAEYAIMIGEKDRQGKGIGTRVTRFVLWYAFSMLNLNRVALSYLATNERAGRLYSRLGFRPEGVLRRAQYKEGRHVDVVLMSMLRSEFTPDGP